MERVNITIVGAGVIGLAIARELSKENKDILVIEKNPSFGRETSSRNSEVIHAGIYHPKDSFKAKTCIEGKRLIYEFCLRHNIPNKKIGKLIVAVTDDEINELESLYRQGLENGVQDLRFLLKKDIEEIEPNIKAKAAIYSPSTGILDTHVFMEKLCLEAKSREAAIVYNTSLLKADRLADGYEVCISDNQDGGFKFFTKVLINAAGLYSDRVAEVVGIKRPDYKLKYCKGDYFRVRGNKTGFISRLIYPLPKKNRIGLGIHATLNLAGALRLGPDDQYVDEINYNIDLAKKEVFYESVKYFLPFIKPDDLSPDTSGIRPKLQGHNENFRDFIIKDECENGFPGFINLIGIESPGFTASLAIANIVRDLTKIPCA